MRRILYIVNARIPTEKAHGYQIIKMAESFKLLGNEVVLLLPRRRNNISENFYTFYGIKTIFNTQYVPNFFFFLESIFPSLYFPLQRISFDLCAFFFAIFSRANVIFSREILPCFFLSLLGKNVVFEDHEPKKSLRWLYKIFIKSINKKIIVARNLAALYNSYGVSKATYLESPNGVDVEEFEAVEADKGIWQKQFGFDIDEKVVLYVGHFYEWKGVYVLLNAAGFINGNVVLIGGTARDKESVERYAMNHQIEDVYIHQFLPHKEIIKYIKSADVLVLPNTAKEERSANFTTPLKLFEYMASGVPIVASDLPSFSYYLKDDINAKLCKPDDPKSLADNINYILNHPNEFKIMAKINLDEVAQYGWLERTKKILSFINL